MARLAEPLDPTKTGSEAHDLERSLSQLIVGQQEAIQELVSIYQMHLTRLNPPDRPIGNFLFLGPTGTGKTRIVEATAECLVGSARAVVKVDCGEFQHSHEIAKLIGSPPGYLGHRETHPLLSQEALNQHHTGDTQISFVLFDEIEKASDTLWNLLLGILDKATLTLGDNRRVDFSRALVFLTSNLGAAEMGSILNPRLGFGVHAGTSPCELDEKTQAKIARAATGAARRKFTPEFVNRLDKIVVFRPLGEAELKQVLDIELGYVQRRIFASPDPENYFVFQAQPPAKDYLLRDGTDLKYGARHLKRAIERRLVQPLSNLVASAQIRGGDMVRVDFDNDRGELSFYREKTGLEFRQMTEIAECGHGSHLGATSVARSTRRRTPAARSNRVG
jgi:ATP-dependent Clp protease ATP-binding subunit ClpB